MNQSKACFTFLSKLRDTKLHELTCLFEKQQGKNKKKELKNWSRVETHLTLGSFYFVEYIHLFILYLTKSVVHIRLFY